LVRFEAVHLDEQLIQRLLALVVSAAEAGAAMASDGVNLVDEDDAGGVLLALLEQVAHARCADADEHLDEVGSADREERHIRFALLLPNDSALLPPLCICRMKKSQNPITRSDGSHVYNSDAHGLAVGSLALTWTPRSISLLTRPSYCAGA